MTQETRRQKITMPVAMIDAVTEYQRREGIRTWAGALLALVNTGLKAAGIAPVEPTPWGGNRYGE